MTRTDYTSVDEYLAAQPAPARSALERLRATIRKALPGATKVSHPVVAVLVGGGIAASLDILYAFVAKTSPSFRSLHFHSSCHILRSGCLKVLRPMRSVSAFPSRCRSAGSMLPGAVPPVPDNAPSGGMVQLWRGCTRCTRNAMVIATLSGRACAPT
jgi:hypothetical protein